MKIWFQLVSSEKRLPNFLAELRAQCGATAASGTTIVVSGTPNGALGDHYASFLQLDALDIVRIARGEVAGQGYSAYALANSLDPALDALREQLDIPVLSLMQVGCSLAPMIGDRFGVIVPNFKFVTMYRDVVASHGLSDKLAGIFPLGFDRIADHDVTFADQAACDEVIGEVEVAARRLVEQGAEVIMAPGPVGCLLAKHRVTEIAGAQVLDMYSALVKVSEAMGYMADNLGLTTSRHRRYRQPPAELMREAVELYRLDEV